MARIPDNEIERLKEEVPIERLVMGFGVELKRHGAEWIGTWPFHEDKTPSLVVSPKTNLWHCLGACNVAARPSIGYQGSSPKRSSSAYYDSMRTP